MAQKQATGVGLTRPELAMLLSFAKIALSSDLIASPVPDDPVCEPILTNYFPEALRTQFLDEIKAHRLRREIIATGLTNSMINRGGPAMAVRLADESGRAPEDVALAYIAATAIFQLPDLWHAIDQLDGKMPGQAQLDLYARVQDLLLDQIAHMLRHGMGETLATTIATHRAGTMELAGVLETCATPQELATLSAATEHLVARGTPAELARRIASLDLIGQAPAITRLAHETGRPLSEAARIAFAAGEYFRLDELKSKSAALPLRDYYDRLAVNGAIHALEAARRALSFEILRSAEGSDFATWLRAHGQRFARAKASLDEMATTGEVTVSRLTVAASQVRDLAGA
jgi:glutamate dehydrogenase